MANPNDSYLANYFMNLAAKKAMGMGTSWAADKISGMIPSSIGGQLGNLAGLYGIFDAARNKNPVGGMQSVAQFALPKLLSSAGLSPAGSLMGMSGFALPFAIGQGIEGYFNHRDNEYAKKDIEDWKRDYQKNIAQGKALPFSRNMVKSGTLLDKDAMEQWKANSYDKFMDYAKTHDDWKTNANGITDPETFWYNNVRGDDYNEYLRAFKEGKVDLQGKPINGYQYGSDTDYSKYGLKKNPDGSWQDNKDPYNYDYMQAYNPALKGTAPVMQSSGGYKDAIFKQEAEGVARSNGYDLNSYLATQGGKLGEVQRATEEDGRNPMYNYG